MLAAKVITPYPITIESCNYIQCFLIYFMYFIYYTAGFKYLRPHVEFSIRFFLYINPKSFRNLSVPVVARDQLQMPWFFFSYKLLKCIVIYVLIRWDWTNVEVCYSKIKIQLRKLLKWQYVSSRWRYFLTGRTSAQNTSSGTSMQIKLTVNR